MAWTDTANSGPELCGVNDSMRYMPGLILRKLYKVWKLSISDNSFGGGSFPDENRLVTSLVKETTEQPIKMGPRSYNHLLITPHTNEFINSIKNTSLLVI